MKWTNPGHQLDSLGEKYLKVKYLYLFGTDEKAKKAYEFLCWLGVDKDFDISFVLDITILNKTNERSFFERPVIAFQTELCDKVKTAPEECAVVLPWIAQVNERATLEELGVSNIFYLLTSHNRRDNFIQNFVCIWMMYRHGKLLSHWTNFLTTSKCNLNCKHCLNFNEFIENPKDVTFEEFKENADVLFSKFDYLYSLHFCGGEPMVVKELPKFINYIKENFGDRFFEFFIITNGTIVPSEETISVVKSVNGRFLIDDYSETVATSKLLEIRSKLEDNNVAFSVNEVDRWFDLDLENADNSALSEEDLEAHKDSCNSYLQEFGEKRFYSCCYQQYAHRAGMAGLEEFDYIDIASTPKMEILEFRQGYTKKGYSSLCKNCRGIGCNSKYVAAAIQIPKNVRPSLDSRDSLSLDTNGLVSICVPVYNTGKYLARCVKSLLAQTYQNLEIVLVNDGSTDHSPLICEEYAALDSRVVVVHKENGGEASAREKGLSAANGEYIMFIDSDDEYLPNAVELLVKNITSQQADLAMGGYLERRGEVEHFATGHLRKYTVQEFADIYLQSTCPYDLPYIATTVNAKLFRHDVICQNGIHFDERFVIGNDAVFICEYLKHASTICDVFAPIYVYYKFHPSERLQGMGWYYPDTFFLFAYVADRMIALLQPTAEQYKNLIAKQYKDLLYALVNAAANKEKLKEGLLPYLTSLCEEVKLFQLGARLDLDEDYIKKEEGAIPIRLISYLIANKYYEKLCALLVSLCKTRGIIPYQGELIRQMVHVVPVDYVQTEEATGEKSLLTIDALMDKDFHFAEDELLIEQVNELVTSTIASRHLADSCALRASEAEARAKASESEAEARIKIAESNVIAAEARAFAAESNAIMAEARVKVAEINVNEAEARIKAAESKVGEAEAIANAYRTEYEKILQSRSWQITKPLRAMTKLFNRE